MERCYSEKEYKSNNNNNNKIDLTLKLSSCGGENAEEERRGLRLRRWSSSSLVGVVNGAQWGPSLGRSCSLPAWVASSSAVHVNNTPSSSSSLHKPKPLPISSQDSGLQGPTTHSAEGVALNIQTSTKQETDSMASQKPMAKDISPRPANTKPENPAKKHKQLGNYCSLKGDVMEILRRMPSVTTTGDGPNGKRIEGFLYKYMSGQVCIVCVCHGNFLTPAEFVMHAGGKGVANPMKHITVFSNSF